jgi:ubiquinone/menaquinone biosynthesis C-methylase UbiE
LPTNHTPLKSFAQADATRLPLADDSVDLVMKATPLCRTKVEEKSDE